MTSHLYYKEVGMWVMEQEATIFTLKQAFAIQAQLLDIYVTFEQVNTVVTAAN